MKTLLLLRHAKAEPAEQNQLDHDRPLAKRGRRDAPRMGEYLLEHSLIPDAIFSSTATRARETTELVASAMAFGGPIEFTRTLYMAGPRVYVDLLKYEAGDARTVLVVGHNPGLEDLLHELTGRLETLATATLAIIEAPLTNWEELSLGQRYKLAQIMRPKEFP